MSIKIEDFGLNKDGENIKKISLENKNKNIASFINLGAIWTNMFIKDKDGIYRDVVQGFDDIKSYENNYPHFGSPIGRYANRISNASIIIDGIEYKLDKNSGKHNLHSGIDYWDKRIWKFEAFENENGNNVTFTLFSHHLDQGFPGNAKISITYTLNDEDALIISYKFISDKTTALNLTNHSYFNLDGIKSDSILDHFVKINANTYNYLDESSVATNIIRNVENTPLDFRIEKKIGKDINQDFDSLKFSNGYDQNFIINKNVNEKYKSLSQACSARSENSGIKMEVYTDLEGVQFYTSNYLDIDIPGKNGIIYKKRSSFCFETGHLPNAINIKEFESPLVCANEEYTTNTIYKFSI